MQEMTAHIQHTCYKNVQPVCQQFDFSLTKCGDKFEFSMIFKLSDIKCRQKRKASYYSQKLITPPFFEVHSELLIDEAASKLIEFLISTESVGLTCSWKSYNFVCQIG